MGSLAIGAAYLAYGVVGGVSPLAGVLADRIGRGRLDPRRPGGDGARRGASSPSRGRWRSRWWAWAP